MTRLWIESTRGRSERVRPSVLADDGLSLPFISEDRGSLIRIYYIAYLNGSGEA